MLSFLSLLPHAQNTSINTSINTLCILTVVVPKLVCLWNHLGIFKKIPKPRWYPRLITLQSLGVWFFEVPWMIPGCRQVWKPLCFQVWKPSVFLYGNRSRYIRMYSPFPLLTQISVHSTLFCFLYSTLLLLLVDSIPWTSSIFLYL